MKVFVGHLATANFDFYFVAETLEKLELAAKREWNKHKKQLHASDSWEDVKDDLYWRELKINSGCRR